MMPGTPMASKQTSDLPSPARLHASKAGSVPGSTTSVAPIVVASARRAGEKSVATMVSMPLSFRAPITARPTGPQPSTSAPSPGVMRALVHGVEADGHRLGERGVAEVEPVRAPR